MNKEYMLMCVNERLKVLQQRYYDTINDTESSYQVSQVRRASIQRDIQIIKLLRYLLQSSPSVWIEDEDAIKGFDKLVTPIERHRRLKNG